MQVVIALHDDLLLEFLLERFEKTALFLQKEVGDYRVQSDQDLAPFLRDVYDHLIRNLDLIEIHRDLLNGATELYLSSVANRTNQVMKVLTVFGTIATPALVITGVYGMNLKHLPFAESPQSWVIVLGIIALVSVFMLVVLKRWRML